MDKIWLKNYDPGVPHTIDPDQYTSIPDMLEECFTKYANDPCFMNFGETLTFKQVDELAEAYAGFLQTQCQLAKGDRVAIMMPSTLQYPIALLGALKAGMVNVNISPLYTAQEVNHALQITGAKCILALANFAHTVEKALPDTDVKHVIITEIGDLFSPLKRLLFHFVTKYIKKMIPPWFIPNAISFRESIKPFYQKEFKKPELCGDDLAYLQFTEGRETGTPKCAMLTHRNFVANGLQCSALFNSITHVFKGNALCALPLFKLTSVTLYILTLTRNGVTNNLITDPREISVSVNEIKRHPPSIIMGIKTLFNDLLFNQKFQDLDFSSLQCSITGGMAIPQVLADRWQSVTHTLVTQGYVLTEGSPVVTCNPFLTKNFNRSVGLPISSTNVKICDEHEQELPPNTRGEIWFQGPQVMKGYWNQPEETKKVLTEDGWFKSGDMGYMNEEGYVYLLDRKEDIIKTDQGIVYPSEVENIITEIGGIEEAIVVNILSKKTLKPIIKAFVIKSDISMTEEIIFSHCRRHLANYQIPDEIDFPNALPRSAAGFVLRRLLREANG